MTTSSTAIIDYKMGNIWSLKNALDNLKIKYQLVSDPEKINDFNLDTYHRWIEVFILSSLLELPTITVPVGFNKNKLPMGMQIIGKKNNDLKVLAFARKYEQMFNYSKIKPEI